MCTETSLSTLISLFIYVFIYIIIFIERNILTCICLLQEINNVYVSKRPKKFPWIHCKETFVQYQKYQKSHFDIYQCKNFLQKKLRWILLSIYVKLIHNNSVFSFYRYSCYCAFLVCFTQPDEHLWCGEE
jgi:hypothetical protein